ncbi:hypothetical protein F0U44_09035 [Nocardioides humilatus]|uniref:LPXTG cell wall anchor domain-containing protein n=1 Tax=Nocardioides humilatus TaxID=2607660 RepID=A0A5B1LD23_9ACTN|nr:hypothetical protein [Nocardioides humilatus]KAA1418633.1 hypothetical protein F0U44_09035 [Nocardioides humilatus]
MKTLVRSACVAVLLILLAVPAPPATAKGPVEVAVAGPGVHTTLSFTRSAGQVDLQTLGEASRVYDLYGTNRPASAPDVAEEDLGAQYVLTWDMGEGPIVQHAYPFAEGGAWVHFLPDQELFGHPVADGWSSAPGLTDQFVALGAAAEPVDLAPAQESAQETAQEPALATVAPEPTPVAAEAAEADDGSSYDVALPAGLGLLAVLGVGGVVLWRRRQA